MAGIVEHVIRDHIGDLALPQMFNQPLCHGLDLRFVLAVIGQLVQPLILSKVCRVERMDNELWQGHDSERGAPHRHGEQQCKDPETKLWYFEMLDTLCQTRRTAGETFRFDFTYPEQFRVEDLSGKTAQFEIKLHSVAEKTTPELNEEFARAQGYADLAAMREAVRAKKRKIHEDAADRAAGQELLAKAGANLTVDLPEAMLDRTADNEMRMLEQRLSRSNITLEKHCKNSHTTAAALRAGYRDAAERNLRSMLASRSIAEAENITVSTLEVNNEYRRLSQLQDTPEADIRRVLSPDTLAAALVAQKVQRFLLDNADITTVMDPEKE